MEEGHKVVKDFKYGGRRCVVIEIDRSNLMKDLPDSLRNTFKPYCNGYIELKKDEIKESYDDYAITSDELTYQGKLEFPKGLNASDGKFYIGFDSAHSWNDNEPKSKTKEYVANTCRKIVKELNKLTKG